MAFTKDLVSTLDENDLRTKVLVPLFQAMGFRDVFHYHGGALEHGKDIVMWKPDDLDQRINYAVVVKAKRITGQTSGPSSAAEVLFQIHQCLDSPYQDPVTGSEQRAQRCWVVSSKEIGKEALAALGGSLQQSRADALTTFIGLERLWELIQKYLGPATATGKLFAVQQMFNNVSEHHRIVVSTQGGRVSLSTEPKHPAADSVEPLAFSGRFVFPDSPEGRLMLEAFQEHLRTGSPVTLTRPYIREFNIPGFLRPFLDPLGEGVTELIIGSRRSDRSFVANIHIRNSDDQTSLLAIEFNAVQVGTEQIIFDNAHQKAPWYFRITVNFSEHKISVTHRANYESVGVKRILEGVRFQRAMASGGRFAIEHVDTGLEVAAAELTKGTFPFPDPRWVELLEALAFIQERLRKPMVVPDRDITGTEAAIVLELMHKMKSGKANLPGGVVSFTVEREGAERIIQQLESDGSLSLMWTAHETESAIGNEIDMGPVAISCSKMVIDPADMIELKKQLSTADHQSFRIEFRAAENVPFEIRYYSWLPEEEVRHLPPYESIVSAETNEG